MLMERYSCVEKKQKKGGEKGRRGAEYGVVIEETSHGSVATDVRPVRQRILCVCPVNQTDMAWPSLLVVLHNYSVLIVDSC